MPVRPAAVSDGATRPTTTQPGMKKRNGQASGIASTGTRATASTTAAPMPASAAGLSPRRDSAWAGGPGNPGRASSGVAAFTGGRIPLGLTRQVGTSHAHRVEMDDDRVRARWWRRPGMRDAPAPGGAGVGAGGDAPHSLDLAAGGYAPAGARPLAPFLPLYPALIRLGSLALP